MRIKHLHANCWTLSLLALTIFGCSANVSADQPPNIVLLMGDDHGWDETGYNGHPHLLTPVLDDMAATGLRLDRFYSAHPSCSPTRGSIITGRHPNRYGTFSPGHSIRPEEISIASLMHEAGYACGHFGKWHLGPVKASSPTNPGAMGFDHWISHDNFFELNPWLSRDGGTPQQHEGESSEIVVQHTIEFLEQAKRDGKPFFAVVWFGSPHEPYSGLPDDLAHYDDLPQKYSQQTVTLTSNDTGRSIKRPLRDVLQERYAEITAMDRSIGNLREWLSNNELRDNTLLWYCGDNGTSNDGIVTSPFRGVKGNHYEGGVRVPGVIEWPRKFTTAHVSSLNAVTCDILPTLCDVVGVPVPTRPLDGISLKPLVESEATERPVPICFWSFAAGGEKKNEPYIDAELQRGTTPLVKKSGDINTRNFLNFRHPKISEEDYNGARAILDNQYKLVVNGRGKAPSVELFDVRQDPSETADLSEAQPEIVSKLSDQLRQWQTSVLHSLTEADY